MCCSDPPHKRNWRLYHLLDLIVPITAKQVKWTFRKVTLRHHYYQAYLVLYNRSRKLLYDVVGEDAYGFIASGTWGPFVPFLGTAGSIVIYCVVLLVEIALLLLFFAFLAARIDGVMSWRWESVVIPLMVFAAIMLATTIVAVGLNIMNPRTYREGMSFVDRLSPVGNFLAACCYFCIPFVIGSQIRGNPGKQVGNYLKYMAMPIAGDIIYYLTSFIWRWPRRLRLQMEVGNNRPSPVVSYGIFIMGFANMFAGVAQWVLIGMKIDKRINASWYLIFIPFCVRAGVRVVEACLRSLMKYTIGVRSGVGVAFDTIGSFFSNGILLISLYFVAVRIERGAAKCTMAHALIPVYVTLGYMFLCLIFTFLFLLISYSGRSDEDRQINTHWIPSPDREDEDEGAIKSLGPSETSDSGPIPGIRKVQRGWEEMDDMTPSSSAVFPEELPDDTTHSHYDDFYTDDGGDDAVAVERSPHSSKEPYGSPRDDEEAEQEQRVSHHTQRSRSTPLRDPGELPPGTYEVSRRTTTVSRRVYQDPEGHRSRTPLTASSRSNGTRERAAAQRISGDSSEFEDDYTEVSSYIDDTGSSSYTEETTYIDESQYSQVMDEHRGEVEDSYSYTSAGSSSASFTSATATSVELRR